MNRHLIGNLTKTLTGAEEGPECCEGFVEKGEPRDITCCKNFQ